MNRLFLLISMVFAIVFLVYDIRLFMDPGTDDLKRKHLKVDLMIDVGFTVFAIGLCLISIFGG